MLDIGALLEDVNFWVLVSFLGFIGLAFRPLTQHLFKMLDERTAQIKNELHEAQQMYREAEELYQNTTENHTQIMGQIQEIFELAQQEMLYLQEKLNDEKKFFLQLKEHLFSRRVEHNYHKAQEEIRHFLIHQAFEDIVTSLRKNPQDCASLPFLSRFKQTLGV